MLENWIVFIRLISMLDWMQKHLDVKLHPWQIEIMAKMYVYPNGEFIRLRQFWPRPKMRWNLVTLKELLNAR